MVRRGRYFVVEDLDHQAMWRLIAMLCTLGVLYPVGGVLSSGRTSGVHVRSASALNRTEPLLPESLE